MIQLESQLSPLETSDKNSLAALTPPDRYDVTVANIVAEAGGEHHAGAGLSWARLQAWAAHHGFIRQWVCTTGAVP
jgi:hypothetical protein